LPIAHLVLRISIVLNWLWGAAILVLLLVMPNKEWIISAFDLSPSLETERVVWGLRGTAALGLFVIALNFVVLKRLLAIVDTVRAGDPFVAANAQRLQTIARALLALQLLSIAIGAIAKAISTPAFQSAAGSASCSRSFWPASSRKARACATTSKGLFDMAIVVKLDDVLHDRRMTLTDLADRVGMTLANLSILKTGKARAIRFSTLEAICEVLACQPGDILQFAQSSEAGPSEPAKETK
jgi:putative transcriptional regulator